MAKKKLPFKSLRSYYLEGVHFVCRFCSKPIGDFARGKLVRNKSFAQAKAIFTKADGLSGAYMFNGCTSCLKDIAPTAVEAALEHCPHTPDFGPVTVSSVEIVNLKKDLI